MKKKYIILIVIIIIIIISYYKIIKNKLEKFPVFNNYTTLNDWEFRDFDVINYKQGIVLYDKWSIISSTDLVIGTTNKRGMIINYNTKNTSLFFSFDDKTVTIINTNPNFNSKIKGSVNYNQPLKLSYYQQEENVFKSQTRDINNSIFIPRHTTIWYITVEPNTDKLVIYKDGVEKSFTIDKNYNINESDSIIPNTTNFKLFDNTTIPIMTDMYNNSYVLRVGYDIAAYDNNYAYTDSFVFCDSNCSNIDGNLGKYAGVDWDSTNKKYNIIFGQSPLPVKYIDYTLKQQQEILLGTATDDNLCIKDETYLYNNKDTYCKDYIETNCANTLSSFFDKYKTSLCNFNGGVVTSTVQYGEGGQITNL